MKSCNTPNRILQVECLPIINSIKTCSRKHHFGILDRHYPFCADHLEMLFYCHLNKRHGVFSKISLFVWRHAKNKKLVYIPFMKLIWLVLMSFITFMSTCIPSWLTIMNQHRALLRSTLLGSEEWFLLV